MEPDHSSRSPLQPPQFTTPSLLLWTAGIAVLLAVLRLCPPYVAFAILLLGGSVLMHVAGNYLGTRLRDHSRHPPLDGQIRNDLPVVKDERESVRFAPRPGLGHEIRFRKGMTIGVLLGSMFTAIAGTWMLVQLQQGAVRWHHLILAVVSCGILGGLLTFWLLSFLWVFVKALAEGHRHE